MISPSKDARSDDGFADSSQGIDTFTTRDRAVVSARLRCGIVVNPNSLDRYFLDGHNVDRALVALLQQHLGHADPNRLVPQSFYIPLHEEARLAFSVGHVQRRNYFVLEQSSLPSLVAFLNAELRPPSLAIKSLDPSCEASLSEQPLSAEFVNGKRKVFIQLRDLIREQTRIASPGAATQTDYTVRLPDSSELKIFVREAGYYLVWACALDSLDQVGRAFAASRRPPGVELTNDMVLISRLALRRYVIGHDAADPLNQMINSKLGLNSVRSARQSEYKISLDSGIAVSVFPVRNVTRLCWAVLKTELAGILQQIGKSPRQQIFDSLGFETLLHDLSASHDEGLNPTVLGRFETYVDGPEFFGDLLRGQSKEIELLRQWCTESGQLCKLSLPKTNALRDWLALEVGTLDNLYHRTEIRRLLGLQTSVGRGEQLRTVIDARLMSPIAPDYYPWNNIKHSAYLDPDCVGELYVVLNTKRHDAFLELIELTRSKRTSAPLRPFANRSFAETALPPVFAEAQANAWSLYKPPAPDLHGSVNPLAGGGGVKLRVNSTLHFAKGEAFEQLVGALLCWLHPESNVIPQYCLEVNRETGFFGKRVDFRVDDELFEVKWGLDDHNIRTTLELHKPWIGDFKYSLIVANAVSIQPFRSVVVEEFEMVSENSPEDFRVIVQRIRALAEEGDFTNLTALRDFLFETVCFGSEKSGEQRKSYIEARLAEIVATPASCYIEQLTPQTTLFFQPLEANFELNGEIYQTVIPPQQLAQEGARFRLAYWYGNLEFPTKDERDFFVIAEMSPHRIGEMAEGRVKWSGPGGRYPVVITKKASYSAHAWVKGAQPLNIATAQSELEVNDADFEFAQTYLAAYARFA
jgi:hypothetical protein